MTTTFIKEISSEHLDVSEWGIYSFSVNGENLEIAQGNVYRKATRAWLYENGNVLLFYKDMYQLLTKNGLPSDSLLNISKNIINNKYRVTNDERLISNGERRRTVCVINEDSGKVVFTPSLKWKDVVDIQGEYLIVKSYDDKISLTKIPSRRDSWDILFEGKDVEYVKWPIFKVLDFKGCWDLFNVNKPKRSINRFKNIISINNGQLYIAEKKDSYALLNADGSHIFVSSTPKYDVETDKIKVRGYILDGTNGLDDRTEYDVVYNLYGQLISYTKHEESSVQEAPVIVPTIENTTLRINKINIVPVGDEIETRFIPKTSNTYNVPDEEENSKIAWLLLSSNQLIILEYLSHGTRGQRKKKILEEQLNIQFSNWLKKNVRYFTSFECEMDYDIARIEEFLNENVKTDSDITDDPITLKANTKEANTLVNNYKYFCSIYEDEDRICDAIVSMHPSLESLLDLTNIRIDNEELYEIPQKCIETNDKIKNKEEELIRLEKEVEQLKVILSQQEKKRKELHKLIIKELVDKYDSNHYVGAKGAEKEAKSSPQGVSLRIGGEDHNWLLNDSVGYSVFNNMKVYGKSDVKYVPIGNNIMVFISPEVATNIKNSQKDSMFDLIGQGDSRRENQVFGQNENTKVRNHKRGLMRVFVFVREQNDTCKFFDQVEYVSHQEKWDGRRNIILFKFKSLLRFQ